MKQNSKKPLLKKLAEAELEYDINRMVTERDYHITQTAIFDDAIKAKRAELRKFSKPEMKLDREMTR
jgi:hypothetical protein